MGKLMSRSCVEKEKVEKIKSEEEGRQKVG